MELEGRFKSGVEKCKEDKIKVFKSEAGNLNIY